MNITAIPFNQLIGIKRAERDPPYLLELDDRPAYTNHLGTVHASAQLALAEATSAEYLLRTFTDADADLVAVVRTVQAKFKKPLKGPAYSKARIVDGEIPRFSEALNAKGMGIIHVSVDVVDAHDAVAMSADIGWFIRRHKPT
jgi:Domain of unknown function (DUF4442)